MSEATVSNDQLRLFMERIERLEEEKKASQTIFATYILKPKAKVMIPKSCVRFSSYAKWSPMIAPKWRRCSTCTNQL